MPNESLPPLTPEVWNNRHKSQRSTPETKNQGTKHIHPCCENNMKLIVTDQTLHKVWLAFWMAGISYDDAMLVVKNMQDQGVLFREEAKP